MHFFFEKKDSDIKKRIEDIILEKYNQYYRLAYGYVHNEADAADIVQNGAYRALKNWRSLRQPEYVQTWIYRIMLNECFRYKENGRLAYEELTDSMAGENLQQTDTYEDIDLQRALDRLPDADKAVVILKYYEEKTLEEIAEILDENISTVKSRLYRSLKKLKAAMQAKPEHSGKCT